MSFLKLQNTIGSEREAPVAPEGWAAPLAAAACTTCVLPCKAGTTRAHKLELT